MQSEANVGLPSVVSRPAQSCCFEYKRCSHITFKIKLSQSHQQQTILPCSFWKLLDIPNTLSRDYFSFPIFYFPNCLLHKEELFNLFKFFLCLTPFKISIQESIVGHFQPFQTKIANGLMIFEIIVCIWLSITLVKCIVKIQPEQPGMLYPLDSIWLLLVM